MMQLSPGRLPAFVGVDSGDGGYLLLHVLSIKPADAPAADAVAGASQQWLQTLSSADEAAYVQGLRQRLGAKVVRSDAAPAGKGEEQSRN